MHHNHHHSEHERDGERGGERGRGRGRGRSDRDDDRDETRREGRRGEGRRSGSGHRIRRGAVRGAILTLLAERPMNGYELITELEARSEGRWRPSPGAMYPALNKMEQHGAITSVEVDHKRQFQLTDHGREMLAEYEAERANGDDEPRRPWDDATSGSRHDLRGQVFELAGRARQLRRVGTPEQIRYAGEIIDEATTKLDALLSAPPADTEPTDAE